MKILGTPVLTLQRSKPYGGAANLGAAPAAPVDANLMQGPRSWPCQFGNGNDDTHGTHGR